MEQCTLTTPPQPLPEGWPADLPLPRGTHVTMTERRPGGVLIVRGYVATRFTSTLRYMQREYAAAGYPLGDGEKEDYDAESNWAGRGLQGRWVLKDRFDCGPVTQVAVAVL